MSDWAIVVILVVWVAALVFVWALCRAAALGDRQDERRVRLAAAARRHQQENQG